MTISSQDMKDTTGMRHLDRRILDRQRLPFFGFLAVVFLALSTVSTVWAVDKILIKGGLSLGWGHYAIGLAIAIVITIGEAQTSESGWYWVWFAPDAGFTFWWCWAFWLNITNNLYFAAALCGLQAYIQARLPEYVLWGQRRRKGGAAWKASSSS